VAHHRSVCHHQKCAVSLTFNLLTSKSNWFTFIPNCTKIVNLVKFHKHFVSKVKVNRIAYMVLYYKPFISKALRYGP